MTLLRDCFGDISMINIQCAIGMMDAFGKDIIFSICLEKRERERVAIMISNAADLTYESDDRAAATRPEYKK